MSMRVWIGGAVTVLALAWAGGPAVTPAPVAAQARTVVWNLPTWPPRATTTP